MSEDALGKIKDKLRKLMNHEASSREIGNEDEANAFAAKIQQLMIDYELEISELEDHKLGSNDDIESEWVDGSEYTRRHESSWVIYLYNGVAKYNFCTILMRGKISGLQMTLIGTPINKEVVHYIVGQLIPKFRFMARKSFKEYDGYEKRNTYIRGFLRGAAEGVMTKLREEHAAAEKAREQVHGLILAKDKKLQKYMDEKYGATGYARQGRQNKSYAGRAAGREAGRNVSINRGVGGSSRTAGHLNN